MIIAVKAEISDRLKVGVSFILYIIYIYIERERERISSFRFFCINYDSEHFVLQ